MLTIYIFLIFLICVLVGIVYIPELLGLLTAIYTFTNIKPQIFPEYIHGGGNHIYYNLDTYVRPFRKLIYSEPTVYYSIDGMNMLAMFDEAHGSHLNKLFRSFQNKSVEIKEFTILEEGKKYTEYLFETLRRFISVFIQLIPREHQIYFVFKGVPYCSGRYIIEYRDNLKEQASQINNIQIQTELKLPLTAMHTKELIRYDFLVKTLNDALQTDTIDEKELEQLELYREERAYTLQNTYLQILHYIVNTLPDQTNYDLNNLYFVITLKNNVAPPKNVVEIAKQRINNQRQIEIYKSNNNLTETERLDYIEMNDKHLIEHSKRSYDDFMVQYLCSCFNNENAIMITNDFYRDRYLHCNNMEKFIYVIYRPIDNYIMQNSYMHPTAMDLRDCNQIVEFAQTRLIGACFLNLEKYPEHNDLPTAIYERDDQKSSVPVLLINEKKIKNIYSD